MVGFAVVDDFRRPSRERSKLLLRVAPGLKSFADPFSDKGVVCCGTIVDDRPKAEPWKNCTHNSIANQYHPSCKRREKAAALAI